MDLLLGFILLLQFLTLHIRVCISCDLKKSKKTFVDESGIEWECSIYCPGFRNCKDQCCGFITLKMNKIINRENRIMNEQKREDQENVDHHNDAESQEDLESLGSSNIAQPSDAEQESTAESSRLVDALPMTKITVVTYNKDLRSIDFSPRLVNK